MNILFLHGLESKLSDQKREVLQQYGTVTAPDMDYYNHPKTIAALFAEFESSEIDYIIGSSMGGFAGFYLSIMLGVPALLFNPALPYRSVRQDIPEWDFTPEKPIHVVLGLKDTLIKAVDTEAFFEQHYSDNQHINFRKLPQLEHRIPFEIFTDEVNRFFNPLC